MRVLYTTSYVCKRLCVSFPVQSIIFHFDLSFNQQYPCLTQRERLLVSDDLNCKYIQYLRQNTKHHVISFELNRIDTEVATIISLQKKRLEHTWRSSEKILFCIWKSYTMHKGKMQVKLCIFFLKKKTQQLMSFIAIEKIEKPKESINVISNVKKQMSVQTAFLRWRVYSTNIGTDMLKHLQHTFMAQQNNTNSSSSNATTAKRKSALFFAKRLASHLTSETASKLAEESKLYTQHFLLFCLNLFFLFFF